VQTTGSPAKLVLQAERKKISADGKDLLYVTAMVQDKKGLTVPLADNAIHFDISGPGEIVATDNGDPTDLIAFPSHDRKAFNGLALAIIRCNEPGKVTLEASSPSLKSARLKIKGK
jgi:beta-galactosidase